MGRFGGVDVGGGAFFENVVGKEGERDKLS